MPHGRPTLENMLVVLKYLLSHPCVDCGESDPRVLDFDHFGPKNFTIGDALTKSVVFPEVLQAEIEKCYVRCSNCHRKRHCANSYRAMTVEQLEKEISTRKVGTLKRSLSAGVGVGPQ